MKKNVIIIILSICIVILAIFVLRFSLGGNEDSWICENGQWTKHGNPNAEKPNLPCGEIPENKKEEPENKKDENKDNKGEEKNIVVDYPVAGVAISLPFKVSGMARVFENTVRIELREKDGSDLFEGFADANSPDIGQFGTFEKEVDFLLKTPTTEDVILDIFWDSPKDGSRLDTVSVPIKIDVGEISKIKVYFNFEGFDSQNACDKVAYVERIVPKTETQAMASLELLLNGPTQKEFEAYHITNINSGTKVNELKIKDGIAYADFNKKLEENVSGSCRVEAIRAEITQTLKQFSNIKEVLISIDGRTEDILQP